MLRQLFRKQIYLNNAPPINGSHIQIHIRNFARQGRPVPPRRSRKALVRQEPPPRHDNGGRPGGRSSGILFKIVGALGFCFTGTIYMYYVMGVGSSKRREGYSWDDEEDGIGGGQFKSYSSF